MITLLLLFLTMVGEVDSTKPSELALWTLLTLLLDGINIFIGTLL